MNHNLFRYIRAALACFIQQKPFPRELSIDGVDIVSLREAASRGYIWGILQLVAPKNHFERITLDGDILRSTRVSYLTKEKVSVELSEILSAGNVPHAILRGIATAANFPDPSVRVSSDIDVLVPLESMAIVDQLLREKNAVAITRLRSQMIYKIRGIIIEVHERLMTPNRLFAQNAVFSDWPNHIRKIAIGNSGSIYALDAEYALVADVLHAVVHHDMEKIIYVVDISCQALDEKLDWDVVSDLVKRLSTEEYFVFTMGYVGWVLGDWFNCTLPSEWAKHTRGINVCDFEPFWKRASGCDSLSAFLARRWQIYRRTSSATLRFKLAWRMCFGEDMKKALLYVAGRR